MIQPSLVERLKKVKSDIAQEAAQAIERLEGEVALLKQQARDAVDGAQPLWSGEVARLRSQLAEATEEVAALKRDAHPEELEQARFAAKLAEAQLDEAAEALEPFAALKGQGAPALRDPIRAARKLLAKIKDQENG